MYKYTQVKGQIIMSQVCRNSHSSGLNFKIDRLKNELYRKIDSRQNLTSSEVYMLSLKLDELINEYQSESCQKM